MSFAIVSFIATTAHDKLEDLPAKSVFADVGVLEAQASTPVVRDITTTPWNSSLPTCPVASGPADPRYHRVKIGAPFDAIALAIGAAPDPDAASTATNRVHWCMPGVPGYFYIQPGEAVSVKRIIGA